MMTQEEKEEIALIIQSAVKQAGHLKPSPETLEKLREGDARMQRIEAMLTDHSEKENDILERIQNTMEHIMSDQDVKHKVIENQLGELKPLRDGLVAASTVKKTILWMSGFIAGIAIIMASWKEFFRH